VSSDSGGRQCSKRGGEATPLGVSVSAVVKPSEAAMKLFGVGALEHISRPLADVLVQLELWNG